MISLAKKLRVAEKNTQPVGSGIEARCDGRLIDASLARILAFSLISTGTLCFVRNALGIRSLLVSSRPKIQQIIKKCSPIRLQERVSYWEQRQIPGLSRGLVRPHLLTPLSLPTSLLPPTKPTTLPVSVMLLRKPQERRLALPSSALMLQAPTLAVAQHHRSSSQRALMAGRRPPLHRLTRVRDPSLCYDILLADAHRPQNRITMALHRASTI
jgi:hypothetical protein